MPQDQKRRLAAIMFTDIVGYTAMIQRDEQEAIQSVQSHQETLEACTNLHHGEIIQYYGDGSLTIFSSASEAVRCAICIQMKLRQEHRLPLRIGIHTGEVRFEQGKLFGNSVNIASRLEGLGIAGSIMISKKVMKEINNQWDILSRYVGLFQLKNVEEPVDVFAIESEGLAIPEVTQIQGKATLIRPQGEKENKQNLKNYPIAMRLLAGLGLVALVLAIWGMFSNKRDQPVVSMESFRLKPLTTSTWYEGTMSWSPDGNMYTYMSLVNGNGDIFIKNRKEGEAIQIVETPYDEYAPRWSPDGSKIAYLSIREDGMGIYWAPATGGMERKLTNLGISGVEQSIWVFFMMGAEPWSSNGEELLFPKMALDGTISINSINVNSGEEKQVTAPLPGQIDFAPSWSPEESSIVFKRNSNLWIKSLEGAQEESLLLPNKFIESPSFSNDGQKVLYSQFEGHRFNIYELDLSTQRSRPLTNSTKWMLYPTAIPNGGLSVEEFSHTIELRLIDLASREETILADHFGQLFYPRVSPDGDQLLYHADRTGNLELYVRSLDGTNREMNLSQNDRAMDIYGDWSPDGEQIAFFSNRDTAFHVWIMDKRGKMMGKACDEPVVFADISWTWGHQLKWSPEGSKIAYTAQSEDGPSLWIIDVETRQAQVKVVNMNSFTWYQNDKTIICNRISSNSTTAFRQLRKSSDNYSLTELVAINLETGEEQVLSQGMPVTDLFISRDGKRMGYTSAFGHFSYNIYQMNLKLPNSDEGFPSLLGMGEPLTHGAGKWHVHTGVFTPNGQSVIYSRDTDQLGVYVIENYP